MSSLSEHQSLNNNNNINGCQLKNNHLINNVSKKSPIVGQKLEDLFKAATNLIQNLPKNGNCLSLQS